MDQQHEQSQQKSMDNQEINNTINHDSQFQSNFPQVSYNSSTASLPRNDSTDSLPSADIKEYTHNLLDEVDKHEFLIENETKENSLSNDEKKGNHKKISLKLLLNSVVAGCIIGKKGSIISELMNESGAKIRLSQANQFFPETNDRVALITGELAQVSAAVTGIIARFAEDDRAVQAGHVITPKNGGKEIIILTIVIPTEISGVLIGQGGTNIKALMQSTNCRIHLASREQMVVRDERLVKISGENSNIIKCLREIMVCLSNDESYLKHLNTNISYSSNQFDLFPPLIQSNNFSNQRRSLNQSVNNSFSYNGFTDQTSFSFQTSVPQTSFSDQYPITLQFPIPESQIGAVLGKKGQMILKIQQMSGAKVIISQKEKYASGTENRIVTLRGVPQQVQHAHSLVLKIVQSLNQKEKIKSKNS